MHGVDNSLFGALLSICYALNKFTLSQELVDMGDTTL